MKIELTDAQKSALVAIADQNFARAINWADFFVVPKNVDMDEVKREVRIRFTVDATYAVKPRDLDACCPLCRKPIAEHGFITRDEHD